ncbi:hypothetical protein G3565_35455, partial [Escherichia coli]|nr:hypothetical protein [Escherichia coli]
MVPEELITEVIQLVYSSKDVGYAGSKKTIEAIRTTYWFPQTFERIHW